MNLDLLGLPLEVRARIGPWKRDYRRIFLARVRDDDGEKIVVYRGLSKREADLLDAELDEVTHVDNTIRLALLHPTAEELDEWSAGAAENVYQLICRASGWGDEDFLEVIQEADQYLDTLHGGMTAFICGALHYRPEDVYDMTAPELAKCLKMAEHAKGQPFPWKYYLDREAWYKEQRAGMRRIPGGGQEYETSGGRVDPRAAALAIGGNRSKEEILSDPNAVNFSDPAAINRLIMGQDM